MRHEFDLPLFLRCETQCEAFVKIERIFTLNKPRCIIGVWRERSGAAVGVSIAPEVITACVSGCLITTGSENRQRHSRPVVDTGIASIRSRDYVMS